MLDKVLSWLRKPLMAGSTIGELRDEARAVARMRGALDARDARISAAMASALGGGKAAEVLREATGCSRGEADRRTRRGEALEDMPNVAGALADGRITGEHADALVRAAADVSPEAVDGDAELLEQISDTPADLARGRVGRWARQRRDPADLEEAFRRARAKRSLEIFSVEDSMFRSVLCGDNLTGAQYEALVQDMAQRLYDSDGGRDNPNHQRSWAQYRFDALMTLLGIEPPPPPAPKPSSDSTTQGDPNPDPTPATGHNPGPRSAGSNGRSGFGPMPRPAIPNPDGANGQGSAPPRTKQNRVPVNEHNPAPLRPIPDRGDGNDHSPLPGFAEPDHDALDGHHQAASRTGDARQGEHTFFDAELGGAEPSGGDSDVGAGAGGHGCDLVQGSSKDPPGTASRQPDRNAEASSETANSPPMTDRDPPDHRAGTSGEVANSPPGPVRGVSERNQIVVVAQLEDLVDPDGGVGGHIPGVGPLPRSQLERLACDAELWGLLFNNSGEPLHLGRRRRTVSSAQRKALAARDEGCVICGTQPSFCEAHHIVPWQNGGNTDIDNLALVCRRHHSKLHDQKLRLHRHPDGSWTTTHYPEMASR